MSPPVKGTAKWYEWRKNNADSRRGKTTPLKGKTLLEIYKGDTKRVAEVSANKSISQRKRLGEDRNTIRNQEHRLRVLARDNNTCQRCGITQKEELQKTGLALQIHHVKDWDNYPNLRYVVANGLTLCISCHRKVEAQLKRQAGITDSLETRKRKSVSQIRRQRRERFERLIQAAYETTKTIPPDPTEVEQEEAEQTSGS